MSRTDKSKGALPSAEVQSRWPKAWAAWRAQLLEWRKEGLSNVVAEFYPDNGKGYAVPAATILHIKCVPGCQHDPMKETVHAKVKAATMRGGESDEISDEDIIGTWVWVGGQAAWCLVGDDL